MDTWYPWCKVGEASKSLGEIAYLSANKECLQQKKPYRITNFTLNKILAGSNPATRKSINYSIPLLMY